MSDTSTQTAAPAAAPSVSETVAAQQAGIAPPAVGDTIDRARYDQEVANHVRERNFYKPAQQMLSKLDPASQQAMLALAQAAADGDVDAIIEWNLSTLEQVSGKSAADVIAARQAAARTAELAPVAAQAPAVAPVTPEQIAAMVADGIRQNQNEAAVRSIMSDAGYPLGSPYGDVIIRYCCLNNCDPATGIAWFKQDQTQRTAAVDPAAGAAAVAAGTAIPTPAPGGAAATASPTENMSSHDRAVWRLKQVVGH